MLRLALSCWRKAQTLNWACSPRFDVLKVTAPIENGRQKTKVRIFDNHDRSSTYQYATETTSKQYNSGWQALLLEKGDCEGAVVFMGGVMRSECHSNGIVMFRHGSDRLVVMGEYGRQGC